MIPVQLFVRDTDPGGRVINISPFCLALKEMTCLLGRILLPKNILILLKSEDASTKCKPCLNIAKINN